MKITMESKELTSCISGMADKTKPQSVVCRRWEGTTEGGIPVEVFVVRLSIDQTVPGRADAFKREMDGTLLCAGEGHTPNGPTGTGEYFDRRMLT